MPMKMIHLFRNILFISLVLLNVPIQLIILENLSSDLFAQIPTSPSKKQTTTLTGAQIFERFSPKVVILKIYTKGIQRSLASGLVISSDGFIATNAHVVEDAEEIYTIFLRTNPSSSSLTAQFFIQSAKIPSVTEDKPLIAELRYYDQQSDIAILKVDLKDFKAFDEMPQKIPNIGERVYAIGNPRGLEHSISEGIVSGIREIEGHLLVQHTAPISPGSSGGALISSEGAFIGMNTFALKESQNLNFAIPNAAIQIAHMKARASKKIQFPKTATEKKLEDPFDLLKRKDYIQAIENANTAISSGNRSAALYCIIGVSNFEIGRLQDAEMYLKQTLAMDPSGSYGQTARLYFIKFGAQQYAENPTYKNAAALGMAAREFLGFQQPTIYEGNDERKWAENILKSMTDISGEWSDQNGNSYKLLVENIYRIRKIDEHQFMLTRIGITSNSGGTPTLSGYLYLSDGVYSGTLRANVALARIEFMLEQSVTIRLKLNDDFKSMTGTFTFGAATTTGDREAREIFRDVLAVSPGTYSATLVRTSR
jgi:hypothetical protein